MVRERVPPNVNFFPLLVCSWAPLAGFLQGFGASSDTALRLEAERLLWLRSATDVDVRWTEAGVTAAGCQAAAAPYQFGVTRGLAAVNGFVLANGWAETLDEDGAATATPGGCIDAEGGIGAIDCSSVDARLANALADLDRTQDAASLELDFRLEQPTILRFAYEFLTFEDPTEASFFDGFAILLDDVPVAGGTTHLGPEALTDPWALVPTVLLPASEYQSIPPAPYHSVPAHSTGRRDLVLDVASGAHTLSFHVADSRAGGAGLGCGAASDQLVSSALIVGLHEVYGGVDGAGVTAGTTLGETRWSTIGHPVPGGRFGGDFQLVLEGVDAPCITLLFSAQTLLVDPFVLGAFAPLELLLDTPVHVYTEPAFGSVAFPTSGPVDVPSGAAGSTLLYQAFGLDPADGRVFASPAKPLLF